MRLFGTGKIGMFLDTFSPSTEKRKSGEVEVIVLTLRVQPFTSQLASAMDVEVRGALFALSGNADPKKKIDSITFDLSITRQLMTCFASSDTPKSSIAFDQVKVQHVRVRKERGINGYACVVKAAFGPAGKNDLEYINGWYKTQRAVTFEQAEPDLEFDEPEPERKSKPAATLPGIDDEEERPRSTPPKKPMFDTDKDGHELVGAATATGPAAPDRQQRRPLSHAAGRRGSPTKH